MISGQDLLTILFRTALLYFFAAVVVRLMGKRSLSNLAPFDLIVIIMIGEVAAIPIEDETIPILRGIIPVFIMGGLQYLLALTTVYSRRFEEVAQGTSTLLIRDGQIQHQNLQKERVTVPDLMIGLREKGVSNVGDVKEAWLEPKGDITVIKTREAEPLSLKEIQNTTLDSMDLLLARNRMRMRGLLDAMLQLRPLFRERSGPA